MSFMRNQGLGSMLKEGATHVEQPVLKNITACMELAKITRSSMGPNGLCKLIVNHLGKIFVTHDAAVIMKELEIEHPAANLLAMAAKAQEEEIGDGTNLVIIFAGELLSRAENLIRMGLHPSDITSGYRKVGQIATEIMSKFIVAKIENVMKPEQVLNALRTCIGSKITGYDEIFADLCAKACTNACPADPRNFNVDNVRVVKLEGGSASDSTLIRGFVIARGVEGTIRHVKNAKIAVYTCAIDVPSTETKGVVLIENAEQLINYSTKEEEIMDRVVGAIARSGANVIVSNSNFGDLALHFIERHGLMAIKVPSKFDLRRLCAAIGATQLAKMQVPTLEDLGKCDTVDMTELGGKNIVVFEQTKGDSRLSTIVIRGSTQNQMDNIERALDDGVNVFKVLTKDPSLVAGGGAFEMEMYKELLTIAETTPGLDQYVFVEYAKAFSVVVTTLAEVSGHNGTEAVVAVDAAHQQGKSTYGLDLDANTPKDMVAAGVVEPFMMKHWALRMATDAAVNVLQVDQIIMAKPAGGPKVRGDGPRDGGDD
jgi:T-complex protein 1 subunit theta